jgi:hypothetical protein
MSQPRRALQIALFIMSAAAAILADHSAAVFGGATHAQEVDMEAVFRCTAKDASGTKQCGEARGLVVNNCTSCHTFVPIVLQQFDRNGWQSLISRHVSGGRAPNLAPQQVKTIEEYLIANFNADLPVPTLPKELLDTWTNY